MNDLTNPILEEIKDLITEGESAARGMLISTYLRVGTMILENNLEIATVAQYLGKSTRSIYYMVKFAKKPEIADKLKKHESWHDVVQNHLSAPHEHKWSTRCWCGATQ